MSVKFKKGKVYIFNVLECRPGSEYDVLNLDNTFREMGADVESFLNIDLDDLNRKMNEIKTTNFKDYEYVAIAVGSHGSENGHVKISGTDINVYETCLSPMIENDSLQNKLKWLILESCRGEAEVLSESSSGAGPTAAISNKRYCLISWASKEGFVAWRGEKGSIYIRSLCAKLIEYYQRKDILFILNEVKKEVEAVCERNKKDVSFQTPDVEYNMLSSRSFRFFF